MNRIPGAVVALFGVAALLSAKAGLDLVQRAGSFPAWFVPAFAAGLAVLVSSAGWVAAGLWRSPPLQPAGGRLAAGVWILLALSFVCTSSVHQLYPFRPASPEDYQGIGPVLAFNLGLTAFAFLATVALGLLYSRGRRRAALLGLAALGFLLLVPNDDCRNPFNEQWIDTIGASPLMFVPNLYAILFGTAALLGVRRRFSLLALAAACCGTLLLGLGHMTRVIW